MTIIVIFPILLIFIGLLNLLIQRNRQDKLNIFKKTVQQKDTSFIAQLSSKRKIERSVGIFERILIFFADIYLTLFGGVSSSVRLKNIAFCLIGVCVCIFINKQYVHQPMYVAVIASFLVVIILLFIQARIQLKREFELNFPEALSLLVGVVSSGNSLTQGIHECGVKIDGVVGSVFNEMSRRLEIGEDSDRILFDSYRRLPFREYYFFILVLIVNLQGGGEVKEIMYRLSKMISSNKALERTRDSKTAEIRMTVKILSIMPFAFIFMLKFIAPDNFNFLFDDQTGNYILYYVVGSVLIGQMIIRNMLSKII
ncbi:type II secretion system F family protein [Zophobihabitans entericus]|uniref:Type II secretion system protein GspF domain-containing protein n=1 Tax=Zophobihabitans entericus TaxID=1635327 RepID=A0A6G9IAQ6_9GAMM|nr:type II secretion system F family protein [Zophobihabitans entericus]QIQ21315.1 hypothetical protein IPMB12_06215 [Zophobihabitans entericus]